MAADEIPDETKCVHACRVMLIQAKRDTAKYGTASTAAGDLRLLLDALGLGTLEDWVQSKEWKKLRGES